MTPLIPQRRCTYLAPDGHQCNTWFNAITGDKLCEEHKLLAHPGERNGTSVENRVRYIDLVNDERKYCYHFKDGHAEHQEQKLIFEFKDDSEGTLFDKLEAHINFLERVIEDVKARAQSAKAVKLEKLEGLSEEERKRLRAIKIEKRVTSTEPSERKAGKNQAWKDKLSKLGASLDMDESKMDEMIAKFNKAKGNQE